MKVYRDGNNPGTDNKDSLVCVPDYLKLLRLNPINNHLQYNTYVDPRKNASERWKLKRKTDTTAVSSIATEVEYTCIQMHEIFDAAEPGIIMCDLTICMFSL